MNEKRNIAFVFPYRASFINLDLEILSRSFHLTENTYNWKKKSLIPAYLIKQFFFFLFHWRKFDHIIISFGGWWCLVPVILGKISKTPTSIILHGTDSCYIPEFNYGNLGKPLLKRILRYCYKNATVLLPVSESLIKTELKFLSSSIPNQGIKSFFPEIKTPYKVIFNGINTEKWPLQEVERDSHQFITVLSEGQFTRKGGELILETAIKCPNLKFTFVGITKEQQSFVATVPENVSFIGRKTPEELKILYGKSKYYLQLSLFEGFGYALCEAMSSGCIPIVSSTNMLPEIVGDSGIIIDENNSELLAQRLQDLVKDSKDYNGENSSIRIKSLYSIDSRKSSLINTISEYS
ncbi:MAG: glycosyltransferase family 4 protein [Flavobacteriales bacterium]|nr:glycosyltransferase family 4 protein [Flavobacteriales bacterium]